MLTDSSKVLLATGVVAFAAAVVYTTATGDHAGIALLAFLATVATGLAIALSAVRDPVPTAAAARQAAAEATVMHPVVVTRLVGGGGWPFAGGVAAGLTGLALVGGPVVAGAAAALSLVVLVGWLATVSAERTGRTINLLPVAVPVVGFFFIVSLMFLMSRILLAVSEMAATWVALFVAVLILGVASFFAVRPRISSRTMIASLALGGVLMTGGGLVAAAVGERDIEHHGGDEHAAGVEIEADELLFDVEEFELAANQEATISFRNREALPHNIGIYRTEAATAAERIFVGDIITGPLTIEYHFTAPGAGTYFFRCDVHPNMRGTVRVV